ncbi:MAG TPA: ATP phosphoribosyltransferase [Polyangiaceae bacterium]|jgi:ATP phosphoribosyltransferase|nr:ATP phosphoribosyltransferase [Polyangiaceae bacterium]
MRPLTVAIPKGRVQKQLVPLLERAGFEAARLLDDDRTLIRESDGGSLRFLLLKPDDVPTYVEYGAADVGIVGRDVLLERRYDLYQPLDLGIGKCRMVVAGPNLATMPAVPRVATKYTRIATEHFASKGVQAEVIFVQGSVELAPLVGLSDLIVDLVETGSTLRDNGLVERETIRDISTVVVANRSLFKLRHSEVSAIIDRLRAAISAA